MIFCTLRDELHAEGFMTHCGLCNKVEARKEYGKEYKAKVEEDGWSGHNQVGTNNSNREDGAWQKSKKGCTREECHEETKKRMSPFLAVMNVFHERGGNRVGAGWSKANSAPVGGSATNAQ